MYEFPQISSTMIVHYQTGEFQNVYRYIRTMFQEKFPNTVFKCEEYNFSELYGKDIAVVKTHHFVRPHNYSHRWYGYFRVLYFYG